MTAVLLTSLLQGSFLHANTPGSRLSGIKDHAVDNHLYVAR